MTRGRLRLSWTDYVAHARELALDGILIARTSFSKRATTVETTAPM